MYRFILCLCSLRFADDDYQNDYLAHDFLSPEVQLEAYRSGNVFPKSLAWGVSEMEKSA
jgi:hypothetical protein